ncbi:hypothetical protein W04_1704 [Pseudoalteromonas sp. SW0106-04]|uniref:antiviral RADAR system accessory protein RdrD n=1 Tax=Pseudoalteromonas sp. SW0106-04 TaxID=1702169 RepID=UPI0006B4E891|nr:antiviral RADAR system accessory protein RdrD [Pseudoalteromonas sp. SW0106-04]GAP75184.1 hypothetical protein W04_1704 [Pseudoalteromonas sp. SW0106-04]
MSNQENSTISSYTELNHRLKSQKSEFDNNQKATYWKRYVIRRIPLFTIPLLVFYAVIFILGFVDDAGTKAAKLIIPNLPYSVYLTPDVLCALILIALVHSLIVGIKYKAFKKKWEVCNKLIFNALMFAIVYSSSALIYYQIHAVTIGLATFAPLSIFPLLIDRTLGWTRQNDRFKLFSSKIQGLIELNLARKSLNVAFSEGNVLEYLGVMEQFESQKYNDTVSDSFYILTQVEKLQQQTQ